MYRVINTNMAHGVREITVRRGSILASFRWSSPGALGPLHACMIASELEIPDASSFRATASISARSACS